MESFLTKHLIETYNPIAIVLHGSRANGNAREHSDWDFMLFVHEKKGAQRKIEHGANIELKQILYPVADDKIKDTFGYAFRTENIKVLFDPENIIPALLAKNEAILEKGNQFEESDRMARFAFLKSALDGMTDYADDRIAFFGKKAEFHDRAIPAWFRFLHKEFKPSDYIALPRIKEQDPELYGYVDAFVQGDAEQSMANANSIIRHIFPDLHH
jgi:predicted nucleotidyltransferase